MDIIETYQPKVVDQSRYLNAFNKLGPSAISPCVALALGELNFTYQYRVSGGATKDPAV